MRKLNKNTLLGMTGFIPLIFIRGVFADQVVQNPNTAISGIPTGQVAPATLDRYQTLIYDTYGTTSDIVELYYNEDGKTVDLSTFDGSTFTVPLEDLRMVNPNGED